jgi:2-methylisocitrate lyase-like PEP mutase family enzyme
VPDLESGISRHNFPLSRSGTESSLAAKIACMKDVAAKAGIDLWINARIDVYLRRLAESEAAYQETVVRARRYREAGASSIFVPGVVEEALLSQLVRDVVLPLNVLAWPGLPAAAKLREMGVRRLSAGSGIAKVVLNKVHVLAGCAQRLPCRPLPVGSL